MSLTTNRRSFLFGASVAGFGIFAQGRRGWAAGVGPNETLNIACIGVGGKGRGDTAQAANHGRLIALCDVDEKRLDAMAANHKDAKKYVDYRELLHELDSRLDAVVVSTPDHTHAPAAVMAMRMGKHVYCQKPLTHSVWEARLMRETARQKKVCTQMGNQGTADPGFRRGVSSCAGVIGDVAEVHVWTNRPFKYWKQAPDIIARPKETPPVPSYLHWDLFLGSAPERPYHPIYHPHDWRGWWDFGTGSLGDMACHTANLTFMARPARPPRAGFRAQWRDQSRDLSRLGDDHLRVPGPRQPAAGQAHLVRRRQGRPAQPASVLALPRRLQALRQRLAPDRFQRSNVFAQ